MWIFILSVRFGDEPPQKKVIPFYAALLLNLSRTPVLFSVKNFTGGKQHLAIANRL